VPLVGVGPSGSEVDNGALERTPKGTALEADVPVGGKVSSIKAVSARSRSYIRLRRRRSFRLMVCGLPYPGGVKMLVSLKIVHETGIVSVLYIRTHMSCGFILDCIKIAGLAGGLCGWDRRIG
jgi:hypothetical protein